jgi:hypothetical protein
MRRDHTCVFDRVRITLAEKWNISPGQSENVSSLNGVYVVIADPNRQRSLNGFHGDYYRAVPVASDEDSFNAIEGSSPNPHALSNFEKWADRVRSITRQNGSNALHLLFRDGHTLASNSDEAEDAIDAQHFGPKFRHKGHE